MKSLEIVNLCLEDLVDNKTEICEYDLLEIKQSLEVLEILRKYLYLSGWEGDEHYPRDLELEICDYGHLTEANEEEYEDYKKVKQWLEENENE